MDPSILDGENVGGAGFANADAAKESDHIVEAALSRIVQIKEVFRVAGRFYPSEG